MTTPTICLAMIVRNEAHIIEETLHNVAGHIAHWVIVDTGSDDGTQELVRTFFAERNIPGELHERVWRDFGHNRTEALELAANKADYIWMVDADDLVVGTLDLTGLDRDSYQLRFGSTFTYWRTQLFRASLRWAYEGVVHEYPHCLDDAGEHGRVEGDYHIDSRRLGSRNLVADKYERDIELLERVLEARPDDERSVFYLAQSCFDAGRIEDALQHYTRRVALGGWDEEVFRAALRRGECLERLERPWAEALDAYLECWQRRPSRAEPLHAIARHYRLSNEFDLCYLFAGRATELPFPASERLFVDADVYQWRSADERAVAAFHLGRHQESFDLNVALLAGGALPEAERPRIESNRDLSLAQIEQATVAEPKQLATEVAHSGRRHNASGRPSIALCRLLAGGEPGPLALPPDRFIGVAEAAHEAGLAPALWAHGLRSGWWQPVPADAALLISRYSTGAAGQPELALQRSFESNQAHIDDLIAQGAAIEEAFQNASIASVRLKGWHTVTSNWWDTAAERTMTDLDVLVSVEHAESAARILAELGYVPIESGHTEFADHELPPVHLPGRAGSVEIHTALTVSRWAAVLPAAQVLEAGGPMSTTDAVTHLIAHAQLHDERHLFAWAPLRALFELAVMSRLPLADEIDWIRIRARFVAVGAEAALDSFLALARSLFGADVPAPRRRGVWHSSLSMALLDRPRAASAYAQAAFLPRALSADRMRSLAPDSPAWRTRVSWIISAAKSRLRRH